MGPDLFRQLVIEHKDRLHTYAAWLLGDREEAADVVQDALMKLWIHRERVVIPAATTWLFRTTHRLCIDRSRRRRRARAAQMNGAGRPWAPAPGPMETAERAETGAALTHALDALPFRDRAVLLLRDGQGLRYQDIAGVLEMPLGSVKAVVHRARRRLADELGVEEACP